jgi:hypothetical protein
MGIRSESLPEFFFGKRLSIHLAGLGGSQRWSELHAWIAYLPRIYAVAFNFER